MVNLQLRSPTQRFYFNKKVLYKKISWCYIGDGGRSEVKNEVKNVREQKKIFLFI